MPRNDAEIVRDLTLTTSTPRNVELQDGAILEAMIVPAGSELVDLEKFQKSPKSIRETQILHSIESFIEYVQEFKLPESKGDPIPQTVIFGHPGSDNAFEAVMDYHTIFRPTWCRHKAILKTELTPEWKTWTNKETVRMEQRAFARFLEDNAKEILTDLGPVIQAVKDVKANRGGSVRSAVSDDGQESESSATLKLASPLAENIELSLKIWRFSEPYKIKCRVFTHLDDERVGFSYQLVNADRAVDALFDDYVDTIRTETELSVYV